MIGEQQVTGLANPLRQPRDPASDIGTQALYQAATRLKNIRPGNSRFKTKDLVGLLLSHGARTWRNTQPVVRIRLKAVAPDGTAAIRLKFQNR
ncbi:hypothetical protein [Aquamicrobium ahrensii]|uniref:Uncharacterized protein n=1 Tax=Aquamicrobium ahrensii TaxID=469551 RepID=A0ABV2KFH8_9HYPH